MEKTGVMVCGHGSRDEQAIVEFSSVARGLRERLPQYPIESGFLEFATPIIRDGLDRLRAGGTTRCLAVPGMLFAAGHAKNDIPSVLNTYEHQHPEMTIEYARELGIDPKMLDAAADRIQQCLEGLGNDVPIDETMLVVVGRGASDPDANSNVTKVMRMLWEGFGFGWGETCYSGVTFPLVRPGLEHAVKLGFKRILVFPYFLFTGVLVRRIYEHTDQVAAQFPEVDFAKVPYLRDHPRVLDTFAERVTELLGEGENLMNCKLCKYREQILGFEVEKGLAQESHHHHVEGVGTGDAHHHDEHRQHGHRQHGHHQHGRHQHGHHHGDHDHHHGHHDGDDHHDHHGHQGGDHGHTHHPYPHAQHPLGPRTLKDD
ncbi:MAG: sirohydrochlorin chelatase [Pseudomonadota bacterium]